MMGKTHYAFGALFTAAAVPPTANLIGVDIGPAELAVGVAIGTVAGVLPDIDHPDSMITKGLLPGSKRLGPVGRLAGWVFSIPPRVIGVGARATMNHRGGTHSALFMLLWTILATPLYAAMAVLAAFVISALLTPLSAAFFQPVLGFSVSLDVGGFVDWLAAHAPGVLPMVMLSVFFGYLAHLVSDSFTNVPVPWPWPFSKRRISLLPKGLRITTDSFTENVLIRPIVTLLALFFVGLNILLPVGQDVLDKADPPAESRKQNEREPAAKKDGQGTEKQQKQR